MINMEINIHYSETGAIRFVSPADRVIAAVAAKTVIFFLLFFCPTDTYASNKPIQLYGWNFGQIYVEHMLETYEAETGQAIDFTLIDSEFYTKNIEELLIYDNDIDVFHTPPNVAIRFIDAGWVELQSTHSISAELAENLYDNVRSGMEYNGQLLGINHFATVIGLPLVDLEKYNSLGLGKKDFPENWDGLYDQVDMLAEKGHQAFYLPRWFDGWSGIPWSFIAEVLNRGGHIIDPDTQSVSMEIDRGPAFETLTDWRRLMNSGAVPVHVVDMGYYDYVTAFQSGDFAMSPQSIDELFTVNDRSARKNTRRRVTFLPRKSQNWGVLGLSIYPNVNNQKADPAHQQKVNEFLYEYSYGSGSTKYRLAEGWLRLGVFSGYKEFMGSEKAKAIIQSQLFFPEDYGPLIDVFENTPYADGVWKVTWSEEFNRYLRNELRDFLLDSSIPTKQVIKNLNNRILELRSGFGF